MGYTLLASGTSIAGDQVLKGFSANLLVYALILETDVTALGLQTAVIGTARLITPATAFGSPQVNWIVQNWERVFGYGLVFRPARYNVAQAAILGGSDFVVNWDYPGIPWRLYWT